jgi:hypothetical protein
MSIPKSGVKAPSESQVGTLYSFGLWRAIDLDYLMGQQTTQDTSCHRSTVSWQRRKYMDQKCGINSYGFRGACRSEWLPLTVDKLSLELMEIC